ncbi:TetR/AcrR family transcriptional regulator [Nocardia sp. NPDC019304]|uniref:TetR/AcrR family transcriptional regulator n=1 Tax=unclassified Nocardia TaxID=2637762 RepID=UPI0033CFF3BD
MSTPRKTPRQQRSEFTFDAILDAAARLFQQHGYAATTTNKIAELAGVSIGTLYHYVPNKDALLYALAERHLRQAAVTLLETAARLRAEQPPLVETIRQLVAAVTRLHTAQPDLHRLLFDRAPRTAEGVERLRELERVLAGEVEFQLRRLEVGGGDPALTALLLVQAVQAQIHGTVLDPPDGRTADECGRAIIDLWTRALTPPATPCRPAAESAGEGHR